MNIKHVKSFEPGVNIYGYIFAEHGVGEAVRLLTKNVQQAGLDFSIIPYLETFSRQEAPITDLGSAEAIYDMNILVINADTVPKFVRRFGPEILEGRYNIGLWSWEIEDLPDWMADSAQYLDEIWAVSSFTAEAIARSVSCPVLAVPHPIPILQSKPTQREKLGLAGDFLFLFCFDFNSIFERKNAPAIIEAFKLAFPADHDACLVLKTINGVDFPQQMELLQAAAIDYPNVKVVDGYLQSHEQQELMNACDAYVSLHRAEGFGLTLGEAMSLGKPLIATAYSGNLDFMTDENSYMVPYDLVEIGEGCDPYPATSRWAEPRVEAAADLMRRVFEHPEEARKKAAQARKDIEQEHTPEKRAQFVIDRLHTIRGDILPRKSSTLKSIYRKLRPQNYAVACYSDSPENSDSSSKHEESPQPKHSHRAFDSLKHLMETHLVKFVEEKLVPDLICGSLDNAKLDQDGGAAVWGWAYDPRTNRPVSAIALLLNQVQIPVRITVSNDRPDVAAFLEDPTLVTTGWSYYVPPRLLDSGSIVFEAYALLEDGRFGRLPGENGARVIVEPATAEA